ncbi:MAG: ABC transporter permease [Thermoleophilia bacterium]
MSNAVLVVARQELRAARTNRLAMLLLGIFISMVLVSGFIGWATHRTVMDVYNEAVHEGATSAPNPFSYQPPLELVKNTVIYVILIGALSAILLGVQSSLGDRKAGVVDMLFSRPLTTRQYVAGKLLGIQCLTGFILVAAGLISWVGILLIRSQALSLTDTVSLAGFFLLSWLFLLPFTALGLIFGANSRRETTALLIPILVWVLLVFVVPQLGTAEHPVSLLNPVSAAPVSQGPFFTFNHSVLQPVSITDHFKHASEGLLHFGEADSSHWSDWLALGVIAAVSYFSAAFLIKRGSMRKRLYE